MNNQTSPSEIQTLHAIENAACSIEQVRRLLNCFVDYAETKEDIEDYADPKDFAIFAASYIHRMENYMATIYAGCELLDQIETDLFQGINALVTAHNAAHPIGTAEVAV